MKTKIERENDSLKLTCACGIVHKISLKEGDALSVTSQFEGKPPKIEEPLEDERRKRKPEEGEGEGKSFLERLFGKESTDESEE